MREERRRKRKLWIVSIFFTIALNFANQRPFFQQYSHSVHNGGQINDSVSLTCRFGGEFYRFYPFDINSPCIILLIVMIVIIMCNQLRGLCPWARSVRPRSFPRICKTTGFDGGDDCDMVMMMMMMVVVMVMAMNMAAICIYPSSPKIEIGAVIPRGSDYIKWVKFKNGDYIFIINMEGVAMGQSSTKISKQ